MELKRKSKLWIALLVVGALVAGLGIQLYLAFRADLDSRLLAEELATLTVSKAEEQLSSIQLRRDELAQARLEALDYKLKKEEELDRLDILLLVNPWNPIPEGYAPELSDIGDEQMVDSRCAQELLQMMEDCAAAGNSPYICSSYRSRQMQQELYNNKVLRLVLAGTDPSEAPAIAARSVAIPDTSEHQLGLAVDIIDEYYTNLDAGQENTSTQQWLMENSWRYGFILRYPNGSTDITGIIYEPWHYRYVGKEFAEEIYTLDVTLEEYLQLRRGR